MCLSRPPFCHEAPVKPFAQTSGRVLVMAWPVLDIRDTANLLTNIMDFRGFDSSIILSLNCSIPRPIGYFPESLSQAISVGIMLAGRLGVLGFGRALASRKCTYVYAYIYMYVYMYIYISI